MDREKDGTAYFMAPACLCSSRNQAKSPGFPAGTWFCHNCGRLNYYRMTTEGYLPFTKDVAQGIDEMRAEK